MTSIRSWFSELRHDAAYALRQMRRAPLFALTATATLALGIGASTAMFAVVDSVLLRPLRFADADRLVMIRPSSGSRVSDAYLDEWRRQANTFSDIAGWYDTRATVAGAGEPAHVMAGRATTNFFSVLGARAVVGRTFTTTADLSDVPREVVLSYGLWQRRYGGDSAVIGQPITVDDDAFTIIGVMPREFAIRTTELAESRPDLWVPLRLAPVDSVGMGGFLHVVGRLSPGVTVDAAQADLLLISQRIEKQFPSYSRNWRVEAVPLLEATVRDVRLTLGVVFGAVAILLLITCANLANVVLGRGVARIPELAVRLSLGATRSRVVRHLVNETLVLTCIGGAAGIAVAAWATSMLVSLIPPGLDLPRTAEIGLGMRGYVFACLTTVLVAVLFALAPSLRSAQAADSALAGTARTSSPPGRYLLTGAFVAAQIALAVALLAPAGLLGRSFLDLTRIDPGFRPEGALTMRTTLSAARYDTVERIRGFGAEVLTRLESVPGVSAAGFANYLPMSRFGAANRFEIDGRAETSPDDAKFSWVSVVGGHYFDAMGIPLLRGRLPDDADTENTAPVFVIDENLARQYWREGDPIGARIAWEGPDGALLAGEIIGIVGSVSWTGVAADAPATAYWWFPQAPTGDLAIVVRTSTEPASLAAAIANQIREVDSAQPIADVRPLADFLADDLARPRFTMLLVGSVAAAALLLAAIGVYGVMAAAVAFRRREIAVRIALGARRRQILWSIFRRALLVVAIGLATGLAAALGSGRAVAGLLHGVTPFDPQTFWAVTLFVLAVAIVATYIPARRAVRVDPNVALRVE